MSGNHQCMGTDEAAQMRLWDMHHCHSHNGADLRTLVPFTISQIFWAFLITSPVV